MSRYEVFHMLMVWNLKTLFILSWTNWILKYTYLQNIICIIRLVNGCAISVLICLFKYLVANSLDHEAFMRFVQKILDDREKYTIQKRNLSIEIDKKIADLLLSSQMVSDWYICIFNFLLVKVNLTNCWEKHYSRTRTS